jgi:hypothetical protein
MPGLRNMPDRGKRVACLAALWALSSCRGNEFASSAGAGGLGSLGSGGRGAESGVGVGGADLFGAGQGGGDAGEGGDYAQGGSPGGAAGMPTNGAGAAGDGATPSQRCNCEPGQYCRGGSTDCYACSNFDRLRFRPPERVASSSGSRFPRAGAAATDLFYQLIGDGLRHTTDASTSSGTAVTASARDAAPLLLPSDVTSLPSPTAPFNFVFDRDSDGRRELFLGRWVNRLESSERAPAPLNDEGSNNFGLAIALPGAPGALPRAFWLRSPTQSEQAEAGAQLLTAELGAQVEPEPLTFSVEGCGTALGPDTSPWVTAEGNALFFSHARPGADCEGWGSGADLFGLALSPTSGLPGEGTAYRLEDVNSPERDLDPSFSSDLCQLYFASDRDGELALYRAERR